MKLTKDETIKAIEICFSRKGCNECPLHCPDEDCSDILLKNALQYLKENEPAPSTNNASSTNKNILQLNNNTESIICQALKLAKIAAEAGAEITYSDGVFVIKPKLRGDNNAIFD